MNRFADLGRAARELLRSLRGHARLPGYIVAITSVGFALIIAVHFTSTDELDTFLLFLLAIAFTAWYAGCRPALLAAVLALLASGYEALSERMPLLKPGYPVHFALFAIGLFWLGLDGHILLANRAALSLLGYSREEYVGHALVEFLSDQSVVTDIVQRLTRQQAFQDIEVRLHGKDGSLKHVLLSSSLWPGNETPAYIQCFMQDLTRQKRVEQDLQEAKAAAEAAHTARSRFLAHMSHDLRTPLNSIIGMAQVLLMQAVGPLNATQTEYATDILTGGQFLLQLLNDVLDLSRAESGQLELKLALTDISGLIRNSLALVRQLSIERHITVETDLDEVIPVVAVDGKRIMQALVSLLSNAIRATPDGGRVISCWT